MKARAAVLDAGNWTPVPIGTWALVAATLPTPWRPEVIHADLVWWSDRASPQRPSFAALAERWGVSKSTARRLVIAFDGSDGVNFREPVVNRSWTDGEPAALGSRPTSDVKRTGREPVVNRSWTDGEPVHTENDAKPMVSEGLQKQKTEAEDREEDRAHVPQGAAPAALGPADPTCDEPDWDALFAAVPLTYDEVDDDEATEAGPVDAPPSAADVAAGPAAVDGGALAPSPDTVPGALADGVRGDGAARPALTGDGCLPLASVTQPPPVTRATDVDALWEAWRSYGTVRGKPNAHRRAAMARVLRDYPLADLLDMLEAAHTGSGDKWRWLQGATSRSDAVYLRPENLLRPSTIAGRMDDAHDWVKAGKPKHDVAEARTEARTQAVTRPAKERALAAWDRVPEFAGLTLDQAKAAMARWPEENQRAMLAGLEAVGGLSTLGRLDPFARQRKRGDFVRGVVEALGGKLTEAELREVG